jgi:hypothetical protein
MPDTSGLNPDLQEKIAANSSTTRFGFVWILESGLWNLPVRAVRIPIDGASLLPD